MFKRGLKSKITRFYQPVYFGILTNFLFFPSILTLESKGSELLSGKNPLKPLITVVTRPESHSHWINCSHQEHVVPLPRTQNAKYAHTGTLTPTITLPSTQTQAEGSLKMAVILGVCFCSTLCTS